MQSSEAADGREGCASVLASLSQAVRPVNGFESAQRQHLGRTGSLSDTPTSTIGYSAVSESANGVGSSSAPLRRRQDQAQPAASVDPLSGSINDRDKGWEGGLWSDTNNIWSTGNNFGPELASGLRHPEPFTRDWPQPLTARARRSMELPLGSEESIISGPPPGNDNRRSLDSLSTLQAIWQAQQHQQGVAEAVQQGYNFAQPYSDLQQEHLLSQQLGGFSMQQHPHQIGSHNGFRHMNGGIDNLQYQASLGLQSSHTKGAGSRPPLPHRGSGVQPSATQYGVDGFRNGHGVPNGAGFQNERGVGGMLLGSNSGLTAAQLQAALQDPATAHLLRQQVEATALLAPSLGRSQTLEEKLLLIRQACNGHTAILQPPPPPPPRSSRPQLPPPMQMQPSPPPRPPNGALPSKKAAGFTTQRASVKDRSSLLGSKPKVSMEVLSNALEELVESLHPSAEELQKQQDAFQKVSRLLKARWPHAKVHQFGSTANSLSICDNNDIDVCLEVVEPEGDPNFKAQLIEEMGDLMMDAGMANVLPLPKARVPVAKFAVPETGTKVDVSVNNTLAIVNTKLLRDYAAIDGRLLQLAFIVKHWAKRRQVNDSYRGTLSSYCYVLLCIHHLQSRQPPVLPCLQAIQPPTHIRTIGRWNCDYYDKPMPAFGEGNKESLAELVWSFFENWAWRHDYNNAVISVRTGGLLTKSQKDWTRRIGNERHLICIEDPFETSHDLGRTVDRQTSSVLHKEFERAASVMRDQEEPLAHLFEPYRAGKPE